ncbi:MAG: hypothetical protein GY790_02935 [Bacteroidetes bacterium]|nr:hypothetical protein [Bacteroidota bacterium]
MEKQKTNPFKVPGDYFEAFPDRMTDRIREAEAEQVPVRRVGSRRIVLAAAAAVAALALLTYPLSRMLAPGTGADESFVEIALLDAAGLFSSDYELAVYLEESMETMDNEEAFLSQAADYLAGTDVEMDLIFE